jgi:hypothetical protein
VLFAERLVDIAPPDPVARAVVIDQELVLGGAAGEAAGVDSQRTAFGQPSIAPCERMCIEQ